MTNGSSWQLGHRPGLDGLRGLAVALVVVSHVAPFDTPAHELGGLGVQAFFTLSGFLITALLLEERAARGRLDLRAFYGRRTRRLAPALLVCVGAVAAAGLLVPGLAAGSSVAGSLTYSANWVAIASPGARVDALSHTWSLAVEEQFYLVGPVLLLGLLRLPERWQGRALAAVVTAAAINPLHVTNIDDWERVYNGTDMRAMPLLLGCLLALRCHRRGAPSLSSWVAPTAVAALVALAALPFGSQVYVVPQLAAGLSALLILAVVGRGVGWLERAELTWLGRRSYGLYLWHWPAIVVAGHYVDSAAAPLLGAAAGLALAVASWELVEQPAMRWGRRITDGTTETPGCGNLEGRQGFHERGRSEAVWPPRARAEV